MNKIEFLKQRQKGIGGSDIGAILGISKWKTPLDIYNDKKNEIQEQTENEYQYWGIALENVVMDRFERDNNIKLIRHPDIKASDDYDWAIANIDAITNDNKKILEVKTAGAYAKNEWGDELTDDVPLNYLAQVQWYLFVYKLKEAYLSALIGGNQYKQYNITRDDELIGMMVDKAKDFYNNHILKNIPPEPVNAQEVLKLYPQSVSNELLASDEYVSKIKELKELKAQGKDIDKKIDELEFEIKNYLKENDTLISIDGKVLCTWKTQSRTSVDTKALKEKAPEIWEQYKKTTENRVLRIK